MDMRPSSAPTSTTNDATKAGAPSVCPSTPEGSFNSKANPGVSPLRGGDADCPRVTAVLLVGGPSKGRRFRPLSMDLPKPLFPIAGRPMMFHPIHACSRIKGIHQILIIGFYEDNIFDSFIASTSQQLGVHVSYIKEEKALGTGGGLNHFRHRILEGDPQYVFVLHTDICSSFPLGRMLDFHIKHGRHSTLLTKHVSEKEARNYGCIVKDPETNEMMHYAEKPETFVNNLINCGVYIFSKGMFDYIAEIAEDRRRSPKEFDDDLHFRSYLLDPRRDVLRLEQDVLMPLAGKRRVYLYETREFWCQIKAAGSTMRCNVHYLQHYVAHCPELLDLPPSLAVNPPQIVGNVFIHPSADVHPTAKIGPNVAISAGVHVHAGARISNSIILESAIIKEHSCVLNSIVGWYSEVGQWARLEGTPHCANCSNVSLGYTILGYSVKVDPEVIVRNVVVLPRKQLHRSYDNEILL